MEIPIGRPRVPLALIVLVALLAGLFVNVTPAAASPQTAPEVNIRLQDDVCLDLATSSSNKGVRVVGRDCDDESSQEWNVNVLASFTDPYERDAPVNPRRYNRTQIRNAYSQKCIGVTYDGGYKLHQWDCRNSSGKINTSQMWDIVADADTHTDYRLRNLKYGRCVTLDTDDNQAAELTPCSESDNQLATFPGTNGNCTIAHELPQGYWGIVRIQTSSDRCGDGTWIAVAMCEDRLMDIDKGTVQQGECQIRTQWFKGPFIDGQPVWGNISPINPTPQFSGSAPYGRYIETQAWHRGKWTRSGVGFLSMSFP